jgi:hypothetical protein
MSVERSAGANLRDREVLQTTPGAHIAFDPQFVGVLRP